MNAKRRESLREAVGFLGKAKAIVDKAQDEEQDALDSMPESLEGTDRYEKMENAVDLLEDASSMIDDVIDEVTQAMT